MRRVLLSLLPVLAAAAVTGCPLDIQVRCEDSSSCGGDAVCVSGLCCSAAVPLDEPCGQDCECAVPGASCTTGRCVKECATDTECPEDWRCGGRTQECELGPRLGERCHESYACPWGATCSIVSDVCIELCTEDPSCPGGYQCSPDLFCVEKCTAPPSTVGQPCSDSMECGCGFCVGSRNQERCRQPCVSDQDCPGGAPGVCERVGSTPKSACKLP